MTGMAVSSVMAAPITTWSGSAGNGNWSSAGNWSTLPTTSGTWGLVFGGTSQTTATNNIGTIQIDSLSFTNDGSAGKTAVFTLSGSTLALSSGVITTSATTSGPLAANAGDTIANAITLSGSNTVTLGAGHNISLTTGGISGSGSISYGSSSGTPYAYVSGSNAYSGDTFITGGQVQNAAQGSTTTSNNSAFGSGGIFVSGSGSLFVRNGSTISNSLSLGGVGSTINGVTQGALRGSFGTSGVVATMAGDVSLVSNATIKTSAGNGLTANKLLLSGSVNLGSNVLTLTPGISNGGGSVPIELTGQVYGSGSVVIDGTSSSSVVLSGSSSYSGGTTLVSGTLRTGSARALGTGSVALNAGTLDLNGQSLQIASLSGSTGSVVTNSVGGSASLTTTSTSQSTFSGQITDGAGSVSLTKSGSSVLYLTGNNSYSGNTFVTNGQIQNGARTSLVDFNNNAFGTGDVIVSGSGGAVIRNNSSITNNFSIGGNGTSVSGTSHGAIRGSFGQSGQTATISGSVSLSANSTITTAASAGASGSKLVLSGPISLGANTLTFSPGSSITDSLPVAIVVEGVISGNGGIAVNGSSIVYLNSNSSYTGNTNVAAGTLSGTGSVVSDVSVENGGTINPGSITAATASLHVGSLLLNSGATAAMMISGTSGGMFDQIIAANTVGYGGSLVIDFTSDGFATGDLWQLFTGSGHSGNFNSVTAIGSYGSLTFSYLNNGEWKADVGDGQTMSFYVDDSQAYNGRFMAGQLVVVPEPSTLLTACIGVVLSGWHWKRRRSKVGRSERAV